MSIRAVHIPSWLSDMPGHMALGSKEVAEIFMVHRNSVLKCVKSGLIPPPRFSAARRNGRRPCEYWTLSDLRKWARVKA